MDVTLRTKTTIPLPSLIGVATIQELAMLLSNGVVARSKTNGNAPQIRIAEPADEPAICAILDVGFQRKLPWQRIFQHPWQPDNIPRGLVITADQRIVGFLGIIGAERTINGKSGVVANLTSWYVDPAYRGWSNALIAAATQYDITYTSLTPGKTSRRVLEAIGFIKLDAVKVYSPPFLHAMTLRATRPRIIFDPVEIRQMVCESEQRILDDHMAYDCLPLLLIDGDETAFAIIGRRFYRPLNYQVFCYSQVFYCRGPALLKRHMERVTLAVMWRQRTVGLSMTETPYSGIEVQSSTMFRSTQFNASDLDKLYSELLLLPV
jgi:acetoacetyl-CoA synthetase